MVELLRGTQAQSALTGEHWLLTRLSVGLILDIADLTRDGGDVIDPLILSAIVEANVAPINQDPALQLAYAVETPPDELRRPVSINAVAASLGLPFETVRRRINGMAQRGLCVIGPKGVLMPGAVLGGPAYVKLGRARYERVRELYDRLKALGALTEAPAECCPPLPGPLPDGPPIRIVNRLLSEYYLRAIEILMRGVGDVVSALLLLGLARANIEGLDDRQLWADRPLADGQRRPIRGAALAQRLGLAPETVRRHLARLERAGYCRNTPDGVLFATELALREQSQRNLLDNAANLQRLFARLGRYGVLARWDAELAAQA